MSQAEKQLELKEAATKRKIQALKQQLLASRSVRQPKERQPQTAPVSNTTGPEQTHTKLIPGATRDSIVVKAGISPHLGQSESPFGRNAINNFMEQVRSVHRSPQATHSHQVEQSAKPTPLKKSLPKLALPEAVKETEYMTAIQKQKARVSRIRRCIVAATVIQRAWRHYKHK